MIPPPSPSMTAPLPPPTYLLLPSTTREKKTLTLLPHITIFRSTFYGDRSIICASKSTISMSFDEIEGPQLISPSTAAIAFAPHCSVESKKRKRLSLPKDEKDNFVDLSSNIKASLRFNFLVDILSSSKGTSSVKLVKVKKVSKFITSVDEDDDFVSAPVVGQVNVTKAEITYRNPSGLISTIYRSLNDNRKVVVKEIGFGFIEDFVVKKFSRDCSWVHGRYVEKRNVLCIRNNEIHITMRGVHDMYGLPMGDIPMNSPKKICFAIAVN
ncbi:unnamed protein product [Lactuca virosa]|uniref:Uncharacterized protein n=1 Tax=Lactuca virosa TaxID=75947 RepID=A0AAU9PEG3_9ASTR|nr:unnamed protein product [Lactuca virosa]